MYDKSQLQYVELKGRIVTHSGQVCSPLCSMYCTYTCSFPMGSDRAHTNCPEVSDLTRTSDSMNLATQVVRRCQEPEQHTSQARPTRGPAQSLAQAGLTQISSGHGPKPGLVQSPIRLVPGDQPARLGSTHTHTHTHKHTHTHTQLFHPLV